MKQKNNLRIIGGRWRGRQLSFPTVDGLRPTHDRVRETLFNWLMHDVPGAHCLDLFAGSGALGFEALSRGAASVTFVDVSKQATQAISKQVSILEATASATILTSSYQHVNLSAQSFDLIFIDPPFQTTDYDALLSWVEQQDWLTPSSLVYLEKPKAVELVLSSNWEQSRYKSTSTLDYYLLQYKSV